MEWKTLQFSEFCNISGGFGFPHSHQGRKNEKYPFYKVGDMNSEGNEVYMTKHSHSISETDVKTLKAKIYPAGTIIFPKIGAAIATNKKRILSKPSTVDNNVMVLVPMKEVDTKYLYYYMQGFDLNNWANKSALPSIRKSDVETTEIPLPFKNGKPDIVEQKRIADKLDKVFGNIGKGLATVMQEDRQTTALKQSLLSNIFHNANWETQKLSDIADVNPKKDFGTLKTSTEVSFVPMDSVDEVTGTITKKLTRTIGTVSKGYTFFRDEDIIFAKITPCMENGKCAVAKNLTNGIGFGSTEFYVVRAKENILPEYLWHFLRQECIRKEATHHFTGAAGHKRVPKDFIENLELPVPFKNGKPDIAEQRRALEDLDKVFALSEKVAGLLHRQKQSFTSLRSSVLSQSFQMQT